jgi:eukaryotic-like serine/threonine-protein kinase
VQKYDALPENVTTASLEALQGYALGNHNIDVVNDYAAGIPLFERAVSLDPNFAMAYLRFGQSYQPLSELDRSAESTRKAYELRERTSESEKPAISSFYELVVTGNLEAARTSYQLWAQLIPVKRSRRLTCGSLIPSWEITRKLCRAAARGEDQPRQR